MRRPMHVSLRRIRSILPSAMLPSAMLAAPFALPLSASAAPVYSVTAIGAAGSHANDISKLGQVVGTAGVAGGAQPAFLHDGGGMVDLNTLIDPASGRTITGAAAINDAQQIVGQACKGDVCQAVLPDMVPAAPEPPAFASMLAGLTLVRRRRVR